MLGPDLSNVGRDRRPEQIEQALRDPGGAPAAPAGRGGRGGGGAGPEPIRVAVQAVSGHRHTALVGVAQVYATADLTVPTRDDRKEIIAGEVVATLCTHLGVDAIAAGAASATTTDEVQP